MPIGEWGIDHDHVSRIIGRPTFWRNRKETMLALWEGRRDEVVEGCKRDYADLIDALDYDVTPVNLVPPKGHKPEDPPKQVSEGVWENSKGDVYKYCAANDSIMNVTPRVGKETITDGEIAAYRDRMMHVDESQWELIDFICERYADTKAVVCRSLSPTGPLTALFGGDQAHQLMIPVLARDDIRKMESVSIEYNRMILDGCAERGVLIAMVGKDFGSNQGCMMSPATIRDVFMPALKAVAAAAVDRGMFPFFHCCGKVWDILDDWVDAGYVGYQSIQETAGMDLQRVVDEYGDRLTLWTGVQCETLVAGSIEDTEREVRRSLEMCMPGGGFIFGSTNSVQFGAKTENYLKALAIVREFGRY